MPSNSKLPHEGLVIDTSVKISEGKSIQQQDGEVDLSSWAGDDEASTNTFNKHRRGSLLSPLKGRTPLSKILLSPGGKVQGPKSPLGKMKKALSEENRNKMLKIIQEAQTYSRSSFLQPVPTRPTTADFLNRPKTMCRLWFVTPGDTKADKDNLCQGQSRNFTLNDKGKKQAEVLGRELSKMKFKNIFSSDIVRAKQTAEIIYNIFKEKWEPPPPPVIEEEEVKNNNNKKKNIKQNNNLKNKVSSPVKSPGPVPVAHVVGGKKIKNKDEDLPPGEKKGKDGWLNKKINSAVNSGNQKKLIQALDLYSDSEEEQNAAYKVPNIIYDHRLRDIAQGAREGQPKSVSVALANKRLADKLRIKYEDFTAPWFETVDDVIKRVNDFHKWFVWQIDYNLMKEESDEAPAPWEVLIISHEVPIVEMLVHGFKVSTGVVSNVVPNPTSILNCTISRLDIKYKIHEEDREEMYPYGVNLYTREFPIIEFQYVNGNRHWKKHLRLEKKLKNDQKEEEETEEEKAKRIQLELEEKERIEREEEAMRTREERARKIQEEVEELERKEAQEAEDAKKLTELLSNAGLKIAKDDDDDSINTEDADETLLDED